MIRFNACYQCEKREIGCHAICEKYQKEVNENEIEKKKKFERKRREILCSRLKK